MRCISAACRHAVCVCVTFVSCVKTNKHIYKKNSPVGSQAILVFPYQTAWQYSDGNLLNGGVECRSVGRNCDSELLICLLLTLQQARCDEHDRRWTTATLLQVVTLISLVVYCGYWTTKRHAR